ncbi:hypothetical protein CC1G_15493 [Coprinopsis cinerea okayama7|uniref:Uncharacterized protein n=1 Tax=Coprinopsis cinerea (strain Okayama-7 / 130 / ATCC MYA-4618 / FGSC 9003) TaxID=240176 RepID=D6RN38_COPC7|nr:hypothetical protein CC1G_15493 [Coprinopsis cinerea okayama7\|eukprot:XP_002910953.1 hypothetical protein CC1G_15493 [Coprinopsis cinerea okayama7\
MTISKRKVEPPPPFGVKALHGRVVSTKRSSKVKFFPARRTPSPKKNLRQPTPRISTPRKSHGRIFDHEAVEYRFSADDFSQPKNQSKARIY